MSAIVHLFVHPFGLFKERETSTERERERDRSLKQALHIPMNSFTNKEFLANHLLIPRGAISLEEEQDQEIKKLLDSIESPLLRESPLDTKNTWIVLVV